MYKPTFNLLQVVLLNHVGHRLSFRLLLIDFLLQVLDLLAELVEPMAVSTSIYHGANEGRIRIFERLSDEND